MSIEIPQTVADELSQPWRNGPNMWIACHAGVWTVTIHMWPEIRRHSTDLNEALRAAAEDIERLQPVYEQSRKEREETAAWRRQNLGLVPSSFFGGHGDWAFAAMKPEEPEAVESEEPEAVEPEDVAEEATEEA